MSVFILVEHVYRLVRLKNNNNNNKTLLLPYTKLEKKSYLFLLSKIKAIICIHQPEQPLTYAAGIK